MEDLVLYLDLVPEIILRTVEQFDTEDTVTDKVSKPFINKFAVTLSIVYKGHLFTIVAPEGYTYDGATIPFGLGKGNTRLHVAAMFHDIMCENKHLIDYNRNLSSRIFYQLLIMHKMPVWRAKAMYYLVDTYQRFIKGWKN